MKYDLDRFTEAQEKDFYTALSEIKSGHKRSHWIWYIFPQLKGLGKSPNSNFYGIKNLEEAKAFLNDEYLRDNLKEICSALLQLESNDATLVMGRPDDWKLKSSMTLFSLADPEEEIFKKVLEKFFDGRRDKRTLEMVKE